MRAWVIASIGLATVIARLVEPSATNACVAVQRSCLRCPRLDGRKTSLEALFTCSEPTILTHMLDGAPSGAWDAWERAELLKRFGKQRFKNTSSVFQYPFIKDSLKGRPSVTLAEILDMNASLQGPLFVDAVHSFARTLLHSVGDVLEGTPLSRLVGDRGPLGAISLTANGQWAPMHIHAQTLHTQVSGRKGWVLAPAETFPSAVAEENSFLDYGTEESIQNQQEICGLFGEDGDASCNGGGSSIEGGGFASIEGLRCCELHKGESLFFPGYSKFEGWWHSTCGLDEWSSSFAHFRPLDFTACYLHVENDSAEQVSASWINWETHELVFIDNILVGDTFSSESYIGHQFELKGMESGRRALATCIGKELGVWYLKADFTLAYAEDGVSSLSE